MSDTPKNQWPLTDKELSAFVDKYRALKVELSASRAECQRLRGILEECLTMSSEEADANAVEALAHIHSTARAALQEIQP